jgi:hypothetical protein
LFLSDSSLSSFYLRLPPSDAFYFPCLLLGPNHGSFHSIKLPSAIDQSQPLLSPLLPYVMQLFATFMQPRNNFCWELPYTLLTGSECSLSSELCRKYQYPATARN